MSSQHENVAFTQQVGAMRTQEAIEHFGSIKKLADALGIWPQSVYLWGPRPPIARQYEIQVKSGGKLLADQSDHDAR